MAKYNDIEFNLIKDIKVNHSVFDNNLNTDIIDQLFNNTINSENEKNVFNFYEISALSSVINLNYQICNGGISQYYDNDYHRFHKACNIHDCCQLDKDNQLKMLKTLVTFGKSVELIAENDNSIDIFINEFSKVISFDEFKDTIDDSNYCYIDEDGVESDEVDEDLIAMDWLDKYHVSELDNTYFSISDKVESLYINYANYLNTKIELNKYNMKEKARGM